MPATFNFSYTHTQVLKIGEKKREGDVSEIVKSYWESRGGRELGEKLREVDASGIVKS